MVRTVLASKGILSYLEKVDTSISLTIGLILGQTCNGRDYVIHLAKTSIPPPLKLKNISEINDLWVADHAKQATKMLTGGMHVIGVFLVSDIDLLSSSFPIELKCVMSQLNKVLSAEYLYGNTESNEKIIMNYCYKTRNVKCKTFDIITSSIKPAEIKFSEESVNWIKLECRYALDETYYLEKETEDMDLKEQMNMILKDVSNNLKSSVILYDGELKNEDETLDAIGKKKKNLRSGKTTHANSDYFSKPLTATILQNCNEKYTDVCVKNTNHQIKIIGQIMSTIWLNPIISFKMASCAIIHDIMRSLSTRLEMHWDSLIEEEHKQDSNSIHEPPRRVMIAIPHSKVTVSDYLFPGEGAEEAKNSVEEVLGITLEGYTNEIQEVEGSVDITTYGTNISQMIEGKIREDKEHSNMLFIIGSIFALIVLILSIMVHFIIKHL